ncbi:sulfurtransferase TusA family protein [Patescibacteria group bacterium]|nr:sulfurtransferase TusA family protein [Patescibacteria group bacterium]
MAEQQIQVPGGKELIDARLLLEKAGIAEKMIVEVLVDEEVAKENVTRLAHSLGYTVEVIETAGEYKLKIKKGK